MNAGPLIDMRRVAVASAVWVAVLVAGAIAQQAPTTEQIARRAIEEVWNRGIFDGEPLMAPHVTLHYRGQSIPLTPESAAAVVQRWRAAFPDFHFRIEDVIVQGDKVAMRIPFTGTHLGPFMGAAPTGKKVDVSETLIFRVENGLIAEMWEDYDEYGLRMQLGLIKQE
jgi:predicted ester cyclase